MPNTSQMLALCIIRVGPHPKELTVLLHVGTTGNGGGKGTGTFLGTVCSLFKSINEIVRICFNREGLYLGQIFVKLLSKNI